MGRPDTTIVWFKRDLRIADHRPLVAAAEAGGPVIPLYIIEPSMHALDDFHPAHWDFVRNCLVPLRDDLAGLGAPLVVRIGEAVEVLERLRVEHGVARIVAHEETGNAATYARDRAVLAWTRTNRVELGLAPTNAVVRRLTGRDDWSAVWRARMAAPVVDAPDRVTPVDDIDIGVLPCGADLGLTSHSRKLQAGGTAEASALWASFVRERHHGYQTRISSPVTAWDTCSRLSPHLAHGTVSLRQIVQRLHRAQGRLAKGDPSGRAYRAFGERLHWHCHFIQKLEDEPDIETRSFVEDFDEIRQQDDSSKAAAWQSGRTGYPMVDACMRALNATGWINFRMRAMLVSFASYDLWQPWQSTGRYLARAFTDYEPGIHWSQVQMQSGTTGINALRMYDPTKQAIEHDPDGTFIRRWVPELRDVPVSLIHQPGLTDANYPPPIVDHAVAVRRAGAEIQRIRKRAQASGRRAEVLERHGSRRPPPARRRR